MALLSVSFIRDFKDEKHLAGKNSKAKSYRIVKKSGVKRLRKESKEIVRKSLSEIVTLENA